MQSNDDSTSANTLPFLIIKDIFELLAISAFGQVIEKSASVYNTYSNKQQFICRVLLLLIYEETSNAQR